MLRILTALIMTLALAAPAAAWDDHGHKGPNGGQMEDVAGLHAELMTSGRRLTIRLLDDDLKVMNVAGYSASALVAGNANPETIKLKPAGDARLTGHTKLPLVTDTQITLTLSTPTGKSGQAHFKVSR